MPHAHAYEDSQRLQKRWILGALGIALVIHLVAAWAMGWYKIPALRIPALEPTHPPFVVKQIEVNPDSLKPEQVEDPIKNLPAANAPANPADFSIDPTPVDKVLQAPQPQLAMPTVPEPNKVIAAADLSQGVPMIENDSAKVTAEIAKVDPSASGSPVTSAQLAQDLISANVGTPQPGTPAGAPAHGNGTTGQLPGFAALTPSFRQTEANLANLPEPVLLRLPADVLFDFDSAQLKPDADPLLSQAVALITKYPQADIHIDGYSDSFGKPDYDQTLSQQRAEAVEGWLQGRISQAGYTFHSQGHGSSSFIVPATGTIDQQQPNRRVEILIQAMKP
ncbi:MAG TPA: OmpA family protein [Candidatus Methylacidiphilales bacterium]|jgi:outer membrane protein OmpA-like peptidoglycan-associated protein|nr:OmpA family protein [Candidatus Methylacidiphilales bacterium]